MKTATIHEAKTNLSKYIAAAKRGEKVFIGNRGVAEIELVYHPPTEVPKVYRKLGTMKDTVWIAPGAFTEQTDQKIADSLTNKSIFPK